MGKRIYLILFIALSVSNISAQSASFKNFAINIKNSGAYYWGEGISENPHEAEDAAMAELLGKIAVNVSSSFENIVQGTGNEYIDNVKQVIKTYSTATLKNVDGKKDYYNSKFYFIKYVKKTDVAKIFEERKKLCFSLFQDGIKYSETGMISDALKNFYFSIILMNSIPEQNINYYSTNLKTEIPYRINNILKGVRFKAISFREISKDEKVVTCSITENGKPANCLEFSYWDGADFVDVTARDGKYDFYLVGSSTSFTKLKIKVKYDYYLNRGEIKEVEELWKLVERPTFKNDVAFNFKDLINDADANKTAKTAIKYEKKNSIENSTVGINDIIKNIKNSEMKIKLKKNAKVKNEVENNILQNTIVYLTLLKNNDKQNLSKLFNGDNFLIDKTKRLLKYNHIKILNNNITAELNETSMGFELRKIDVLNKYFSLNKRTAEYLILDFDKSGKLIDVNFGVINNLYQKFVGSFRGKKDWLNRQIIVKFLEKYRTAFLTRDIKVLDEIFAEKALIIVGRLIKAQNKNSTDLVKYVKLNDSQPTYEQIRYTKEQYLKKQKKIFRSRQDITLDYSQFNIFRKNNTKGIFGISLRQRYLSTNYSDEGYLFLLIDFKGEHPQIYVRSWQPQEWDESTLIELSNFSIED